MRILVCGGRHFSDRSAVARALAPYKPKPITNIAEHKIIHGGASGADQLAGEWAECFGVPFREFPANWTDLSHADAVIRTRHDGTKYDAKAGSRRNQRMIDEGKPDLVIAFPGDRGTADMVAKARKAGIEVIEVKP